MAAMKKGVENEQQEMPYMCYMQVSIVVHIQKYCVIILKI